MAWRDLRNLFGFLNLAGLDLFFFFKLKLPRTKAAKRLDDFGLF